MAKLKKLDKVIWRGAWGKDLPKEVIVTDIDVWNGTDLIEVDEVDWELVISGREVVVSLDNGFWAYGFQLSHLI